MNVINHGFRFVLKYATGNIIEIRSLQFRLSLNFIKAPKKSPFSFLFLQFVNRRDRYSDRSFHRSAARLQIMQHIFVDHECDNCRWCHPGEVYT